MSILAPAPPAERLVSPVVVRSHRNCDTDPKLLEPIKYFFDPAFADHRVLDRMLGAMPKDGAKSRPDSVPKGATSYMAHLWSVPLLNAEQEQHQFRKLNLLKHLATEAQQEARRCRGSDASVVELQRLHGEIELVRNEIVEANLRLVVSIAKRYGETQSGNMDDFVSAGNEALLRAVDLFDFRRGLRFSTYAHCAVRRAMQHVSMREERSRARFQQGAESWEDGLECQNCSRHCEAEHCEIIEKIDHLLAELGDRDRELIIARFGFKAGQKGQSFSKIATRLGVSKSRVAQLFHRSIERMRESAMDKGWSD